MIKTPWLCVIVVALLAAFPLQLRSEIITVTGINGVAGVNGADGNPAGAGTPGTDGQSATAVADAPDAQNSAGADGGSGGDGGNGGAGTPPGDGAFGGDGGDATAVATTQAAAPEASATANATGGSGGAGGEAGGFGARAGDTGTGGDATAIALTENSAGTAASHAISIGGAAGQLSFSLGSSAGGTGGNARSQAAAATAGDGHSVSAEGEAYGGIGGRVTGIAGAGGAAHSSSTGVASGHSDVAVSDFAAGGEGGSVGQGGSGGAGGSASSFASGATAGGTVSVAAEAIGGNGGFGVEGGNGGVAQVIATGNSNGSEDVSVSATQTGGNGGDGGFGGSGGDGASSFMDNAVNGFTRGALTLTQTAFGGNGGGGDFGAGLAGNAGSSLKIRHSRALTLSAASTAIGGEGGGSREGGNGGDATATTILAGARSISAAANATGGDAHGFRGSEGGDAVANAVSDVRGGGGDSLANAVATGGAGFQGISAPGGGLFHNGDATATAAASGSENVNARAIAKAGFGAFEIDTAPTSGLAWARASGAGRSGTAHAEASSLIGQSAGLFPGSPARDFAVKDSDSATSKLLLVATADAPIAGAGTSEAKTIIFGGGAAPRRMRADSFSLWQGTPRSQDVVPLLDQNARTKQVFASSLDPDITSGLDYIGPGRMLGLGAMGAFNPGRSRGTKTFTQSAEFHLGDSNSDPLRLGLLNPAIGKRGFESIHFQVNLDGGILFDETFTNVVAAKNFFDDYVLDCGIAEAGETLSITTEITARKTNQGFSSQFLLGYSSAALVPPPATHAMLDSKRNFTPKIAIRESVSEAIGKGAPNIVEIHRLGILITASMEDVDMNGFDTQTPVQINVGDFHFNAVLGDDPTYLPGFNEARFAVSGGDAGSPSGSVVLYWTPARLSIAVEGVDIDCLGIGNLPWTTGSFNGTGALFMDLGFGSGSGSTALTSEGRGKISRKIAGGTAFTLHSLTISATVDKQRPMIEITAAAIDTTAANPTVSISGEVFDESFTAQITRVTVNGRDFEGEVLLADPDENGMSSFQIDALELSPGANVIEIESTDFNGNAATVRRTIRPPK